MRRRLRAPARGVGRAALVAVAATPAAAAGEPAKPIEFVVPAGTGGGADQMARLIAGIAEKHKLSPRPIIVVNKAGGAGGEGVLPVKRKKGADRNHSIIITPSELVTTPLPPRNPVHLEGFAP